MQDPLISRPPPYLQGRQKSPNPPAGGSHHLLWPPSKTQHREPSSGCQTESVFRRIVLRGFIVGRVIPLS